MKKSVKYIILGLIILAAVAGGIYSLNAPVTVPLTIINRKTAELSFSEQGLVIADNIVQIYPITQGELIQVNVKEGQNVQAGDILCVINSDPFKLKINQIRSGIKGYEAQLANLDTEADKAKNDLLVSKNSLFGELKALEAQEESSHNSLETQNVSVNEKMRLQNILIEQNQKDLDRAEDALNKAEALYNAGSISRADYEDAQVAVSKCKSALEASKQELSIIASSTAISNEDYYTGMKDSLNAQIDGINQSLNKDYTTAMKEYYRALIQADEANITQLEKDISNCNVSASVGGIITKLSAKSTNFVSSATPVAEITVPGGNMIEVYVSTKDVDSIRTGDIVDLTLKRREGDVVFTGEITHIDATAEVKLSALGVEERKVKVEITPQIAGTGDASLGIGYNVDVKFFIYNEENKFTVPKTALFNDDGKDMIWVVRNDKAEAIEVLKGMELRTETVIESGLKEGDYVVTDANNKDLKNGVKIKDA